MKHRFTVEEKERIEREYSHTPTSELALALGCPIHCIYSYAYSKNLKKTKEYLSSPACGRLIKGHKGNSTTFRKGHTPANKGKKMDESLKEKVAHTWFKSGNLPTNTKYDGHISARKDKTGRVYLHVRIAIGRYVLLHRHIWEQAHGEIPPKHVVTFKDGDTMNCSIDNLELITMKENRRRNSFHEQVPPELQPVKRLVASVKQRITKQQKRDEK